MASLTKLVARLSPELRNALESGVGEAIKRKAAAVETAHWLFHIIFGSDSDLQAFLEGQGVQMSDLQAELERAMPMGAGEGGKQPTISGSVTKLIEQAWLLASVELNLGQITPEVFLLATQQPNALGVRAEALAALKPMSTDALQAFCTERGKSVPAAAGGSAAAAAPVDGTALEKYTVNLTELARKGELDTVLGRTNEVAKAIDVLLRKRQNNPILLGAPGVGKTAVVEGLAQKIAAGEVPDQLKGADLVSLDMGLLQAGASVKGEFEERLKNVIKEVQASDTPIIVFIDEAHTMIGAGGTEGQNDAANLLKPALARGEFRTVAATTFAEYKKYFEKDPALSRRFQPITIDEPGRDAAVNILRAVSEGLSKHHDVFVREEAIKAAVDLSIRFMPSRRLPDKAISLMDTACARVALSQHARPPDSIRRPVHDLVELIREVAKERRIATIVHCARHHAGVDGDVRPLVQGASTQHVACVGKRGPTSSLEIRLIQVVHQHASLRIEIRIARTLGLRVRPRKASVVAESREEAVGACGQDPQIVVDAGCGLGADCLELAANRADPFGNIGVPDDAPATGPDQYGGSIFGEPGEDPVVDRWAGRSPLVVERAHGALGDARPQIDECGGFRIDRDGDRQARIGNGAARTPPGRSGSKRLVVDLAQPIRCFGQGAKRLRIGAVGLACRVRKALSLFVRAVVPVRRVVDARHRDFAQRKYAIAVNEKVGDELFVGSRNVEVGRVHRPRARVQDRDVRVNVQRLSENRNVAQAWR